MDVDLSGLSSKEQLEAFDHLLKRRQAEQAMESRQIMERDVTTVNIATDGGMAGTGAMVLDLRNMEPGQGGKLLHAALEARKKKSSTASSYCYAQGPNSMAGNGAIRVKSSHPANIESKPISDGSV